MCIRDSDNGVVAEPFGHSLAIQFFGSFHDRQPPYLLIRRSGGCAVSYTHLSPLFLTIPSFATAPALIIVGFYMMGSAVKIDFNDPSEGIPAFRCV